MKIGYCYRVSERIETGTPFSLNVDEDALRLLVTLFREQAEECFNDRNFKSALTYLQYAETLETLTEEEDGAVHE